MTAEGGTTTSAGEGGWHAASPAQVLEALGSSPSGLSAAEARDRLDREGPNRLEPPARVPWWRLLLRQFASPLIYILIAAAAIALLLGEVVDAAFIAAVLVVNALIGFVNEAQADRKVRSLSNLVRTRARVRRHGIGVEVDGEEVVRGDILLLESGSRIPADARLVETQALRVDEGLLTGESVPVEKGVSGVDPAAPLADRSSMAFAGTFVTSGRAVAVVTATGARTQVGDIARQMGAVDAPPPPLVLRMRRFAHLVGAATMAVSVVLVAIGMLRRQPLDEVLLGAIALAVSAVPEGLPIALTVALAVAVQRMAGRQVVVRHLPAVEALGSCGVIATDKTGTLTRNELTVERILAGGEDYRVTGVGYEPEGDVLAGSAPAIHGEHAPLHGLLEVAVLANEASLVRGSEAVGGWAWSGDPTDVALLAVAIKGGLDPSALRAARPERAALPFEPERRYAASFREGPRGWHVSVKGAPERVLEMCTSEAREGGEGDVPLDVPRAMDRVVRLMDEGYRVLAIAEGRGEGPAPTEAVPDEPSGLRFLGFVAMTDPPREGVEEAIGRCRRAGVRVIMITGDHAVTAAAIARRVGIAEARSDVLEGSRIAAMDDEALASVMERHVVVARATPGDKLRVVRALQRAGAFVAVTGDGVNDAPALRQANLGVAMGRSGTDVAREAAELVITDDDFSSIVAGIEEGRVAYDNVRKVTYLLVSTGAGEVLLVLSAVMAGLPVPFTAAQLLWLNLVTNGIQDVALAFEPGEPGVLDRSPRPPRERIFNPLMVERTLLAGATFAALGLACWTWWLREGLPVAEARNLMVQLFVLFEIMHVGNARSENISLFRLSPLRNRVLLLGTLTAMGIHFAALNTPLFQRILGVAPLPLGDWVMLASVAAVIVLVMELHKKIRGGARRARPVTEPDGI